MIIICQNILRLFDLEDIHRETGIPFSILSISIFMGSLKGGDACHLDSVIQKQACRFERDTLERLTKYFVQRGVGGLISLL